MHLILGGSGFVGRHVALLLARAGHQVRLAHRREPLPFPPEVRGLISWVPFELRQAEWDGLIETATVVHHYAWSTIPASANTDPVADLQTNVEATLGLLESARRRKAPPRIVFASSGGTVYGRLQRIPVPEDHPVAPITAYGASKAAVELYLGYYRSIHGLDCRVARISNPFGAGQDINKGQGAATRFLSLALQGLPIRIWGDGEVIRDYVHIADVASGLVKMACAEDLRGHWRFNLSSGHGVSLNGIVTELEARLGRALDVSREDARSFDIPVSVLDHSLASEILKWQPALSFSDGMARTIADLRDAGPFSTM